MSRNLSARLMVAAIGIPALLLVCFVGGYALYIFCLLVAVLGSWELSAMLLCKGVELTKGSATILAIGMVSLFQFLSYEHAGLFIFLLFVLAAFFKVSEKGTADFTQRLALGFLAALYPGFFISFSILIHRDLAQAGWVFLAFTMVNTWLADTFAYAFGCRMGKRKLAAKISPEKTWVGFIFSFPGGLLAALAAYFVLDGWSLLSLALVSVVATLFGQLGDLIESAIKRDCAVKDSSSLIPGHGGVLDRFDSLLLALPAVYLTLRLLR